MALDTGDRSLVVVFLMVLTVGIGVLRITLTYNVFWQTWDEPAHIAAGMQWLDRGQYTYEPYHPPLARVMSALGLYLNNVRSIGETSMWTEGNAILHANSAYEHNLGLARLGILPFFMIGSLVVALWSNRLGPGVAFLSVVLFTTLPTILAHSGFATLDMACAALVTGALLAFCLWLEQPTFLRSQLLGLSAGAAILTKLSALGFLLASGGLIAVVHGLGSFWRARGGSAACFGVKGRIVGAVVATLTCFLVIWAGYRFSTQPLVGVMQTKERPYPKIDTIFGTSGPARDLAYFFVETVPVPAPEFVKGIADFVSRNERGHPVYFLGENLTHGSWYFFPLVLLVKTPLPFLLLTVIGFVFVLRATAKEPTNMWLLMPGVAAVGIVAIGMLGSINNGVRQILPVYPLLAIVAGYGASRLLWLQRPRYVGAWIVAVLLSLQIASSVAAHPDYLAYFNPLAGAHPENIVVDGDLDWGQDLKRLATTVNNRRINELALSYNGSLGIDLDQFGLPPRRELVPHQKTKGWIAISLFSLQQENGYSWLKQYQPIERVGKSIWLYHISED